MRWSPPRPTVADAAAGGRHGTGRARRKRVGVGIADQLLYSLTNFALTVLVARSVSAAQFGAFALVMAAYLTIVAVVRGLTSETLVVRLSAAEPGPWRRGAIAGNGAAVVFGLLAGAGMVAFGILTHGSLASTAIAVGVAMPGLMVQDYLRFAALSCGRPAVALANDTVQAVVQFGLTGVLLAMSSSSPYLFVAAWGIGAHAGALVGLVALRLPIRPDRVMSWLRDHGSFAARYAADDLAQQGSQQATTYVVAATAGLVDTGALRGAQTVFGPPSILNLGVQAAITPELVRIRQRSLRRLRVSVLMLGAALGGVGAVWAALAVLCPHSVGVALFGSTWAHARPLLIYFGIAQAANGTRVGAMAGLRSLSAANRTLVARSIVLVLGLTFQVAGAVVDGARGVAIAVAVVSPIQAVAWWWQFLVAMREARRADGARRMAAKWQQLVDSSPEPERWADLSFYSST